MRRLSLLLSLIGSIEPLSSKELMLNISLPAYRITTSSDGASVIEGSDYTKLNIPGKPSLACRILFIALPPGAEVSSVEIIGERKEIGNYRIEPALPILPMIDRPKVIEKRIKEFKRVKEKTYASDRLYPELLGELIGEGNLRKYRFVVVALYPFAYRAKSKRLYFAKEILLKISYTQNPKLIDTSLLSDGTYDKEASELFYNWSQAKGWYSAKDSKTTDGYLIITSSSLVSAVQPIKDWKCQLGYDVEVTTKEWIDENVSGIDLQQKIRNYLRSRLPNIAYVLIVGSDRLIPMRRCCPWPDDPDGPDDSYWQSPVPTDLYYADLSFSDSLSWDKDGDGLYGEWREDKPDFAADVGLGRIPFDDSIHISHILKKIKRFEQDTSLSYKSSYLLAGGILYYDNENGWDLPGEDGATVIEKMIDDKIITRSYATTLYEKEGLAPCEYDCDYPDNEENIILQWKRKGLFIEHHHGSPSSFSRKVWTTDDGDSIPEDKEMSYPKAFRVADIYQLDDDYPTLVFLGSCLNGFPENIRNLGAFLLNRGAVATISASRISYGAWGWAKPEDGGNSSYLYFFCKSLLKDTSIIHGIVGLALNRGRYLFMEQGGGYYSPSYYANAYGFNLYGDPSLSYFGYPSFAGIAERTDLSPLPLLISNPAIKEIKISYYLPKEKRVILRVWDKTGRLVKTLLNRIERKGYHTVLWQGDNDRGEKVSAGVYFLEFDTQIGSLTKKIILLK